MYVHINFNNFHLVVLEIESGVKNRRISHYPFNVGCAPVEIISIYKSHNSKLYCSKLREAVSNSNGDTVDTDDGADVQIEVRWLYRLHEIPGTGKSASRIATEMEEVFETDHLDKCPAESILLPVVLLEDKQPIEEGPCVRYYCTRYWSLHRKSFIPIGSPSGRLKRGRLLSEFFGNNGPAKLALRCLNQDAVNETSPVKRNQSWREAFQSAIRKLSVAEAAQDVQLRGMEMACRGKERKEVFDFLNTAICGRQVRNKQGNVVESMAIKSSMFIAGPPGTGWCFMCDYIGRRFCYLMRISVSRAHHLR